MLLSQKEKRSCKMTTFNHCKVLIVGAGISGLSAAAALNRGGKHDVTILEARARIGGRISTVRIDGATIEEGATWVHGKQGNPLHEIIEEENIQVTEWDYLAKRKASAWLTDIDMFTEDDVMTLTEACRYHLSFMEDLYTYEGDPPSNKRLVSFPRGLSSTLNDVWKEFIGKEASSDRRYLLESLKRIFFLYECADTGACPLSHCPIRLFDDYRVFKGDDVIIDKGYDQILNYFQKSIPASSIQFNCDVMSINWGDQSQAGTVEVTYNVRGIGSDVIKADHVIVTVPLGCLKRDHVTLFTPGLPKNKVNAIEKIGFGKIAKIVLVYDKPFWGREIETIELLWQPEEMTSYWGEDLVEFVVRRSESVSWLETWIPGDKAIQVEQSDPDDIARIVTNMFKQFTGNPNIPLPNGIHVSKFTTSKYTNGSYSYISHISTGDDFDVLREPLDGVGESSKLKVLFAGEATSRHGFGTVHGALLSGKREADRILEHYGNSSIASHL